MRSNPNQSFCNNIIMFNTIINKIKINVGN